MYDNFLSRSRLGRGIPALLVVGALTLGACGTSSGDSSAGADIRATTVAKKNADKNKKETGGSDGGNDKVVTGKINALVPVEAKAPDGLRMVRAECQATKAEKEPNADGLSERFQPIVFAVPDAWETRGGGSGGSGSALGTDYRIDFDNEARDRVTVEYDWDSRDVDGRVLGSGNKPSESFDYDITTADIKTRIKFNKVATLEVADQKVDLFYLDPEQAPKHLNGEEYRARIQILESSMSKQQPSKLRMTSFVLKITFKSDAPFTQDDVVDVVTSVNMPKCTWDEVVEGQEVSSQMDLNGDGKFTTTEEYQKQLQEKLAGIQSELEAKRDKTDE